MLRTERESVRRKLTARVKAGRAILDREIRDDDEFQEAKEAYYSWTEFNEELLQRVFTTDKFASEYSFWVGIAGGGRQTLAGQITGLRKDIADRIRRLDSIIERLDLIDEAAEVSVAPSRPQLTRLGAQTNKVFVVHGRDDQMRDSVARFLQGLALQPIILSEQANRGRTIIEKFEQEADVGFAVILLSPDDSGALIDSSDYIPRARQNVILELGYFVGKLGRDRVCALLKGDLELPSDIIGIAYTAFDGHDGWKLKLGKELRVAGYDVDLNSL